ncbi:hypothetical protein P280DRAFT_552248 [Massarina eburnea CBS 473.64]|uniref:Uncharacterized protein n=1 Tax=Massarina eburnea CBS 473.64 TaxID=1395130 RepID=A0A6A6RQB8_9PLEO|nr:hypothetical protein P280DRAFT_552248 [Massarina eburnea CBS 473.64]
MCFKCGDTNHHEPGEGVSNTYNLSVIQASQATARVASRDALRASHMPSPRNSQTPNKRTSKASDGRASDPRRSNPSTTGSKAPVNRAPTKPPTRDAGRRRAAVPPEAFQSRTPRDSASTQFSSGRQSVAGPSAQTQSQIRAPAFDSPNSSTSNSAPSDTHSTRAGGRRRFGGAFS